MKAVVTTFITLLISANYLFAQAPEAFSYQGVALDAKGVPVTSKQISLRISVLQGSSSGTEVLQETHTPTTDKYGQFSVAIGQGTAVSGSMSAIQWGSSSHYLKAEIDVDGGSNYVNVGTSQLLSVPYALNAGSGLILSDGNYNTKGGSMALQNLTTGSSNSAFGYLSLYHNLNGFSNSAFGQWSLYENQTGYWNTAVGMTALSSNTSGRMNTAVGVNSLTMNKIGNDNTAIGTGTLLWNDGSSNTAIGFAAGSINSTGTSNTFIGARSTALDSALNNATAIGAGAIVKRSNQIQLGNESIDTVFTSGKLKLGNITYPNVDGDSSYVLTSDGKGGASWEKYPESSILSDSLGNTKGGSSSLINNITGKINTSLGDSALFLNTVGGWNTAIGASALKNNNDFFNTAVGTKALYSNLNGTMNTATGHMSLNENISGDGNVANGTFTLNKNTTGEFNTAVGLSSLSKNTIGSYNLAVGHAALNQNTIGNRNSSNGPFSLMYNIDGDYNTANGHASLYRNSSGIYNTAIGDYSGRANKTGSYNTYLGSNTRQSDSDFNNIIVIGYNAIASTSNTVSIGNGDVTKWVFGIPTTTNVGYAFQVGSTTSNGNGAYLTNGGTWTNSSSRDFKENFEDIDGAELLNQLEKLKVQKWSYKGTDEVHVGPVAEEFKSLFNLGVKNDNKHISTLDASGIALKAIQQLNAENNKLKAENTSLKNKYQSLEERIIKLEQLINTINISKN